jgi:hypothetical protein
MSTMPNGWRAWTFWAALAFAEGVLDFLGHKAAALVWTWASSL